MTRTLGWIANAALFVLCCFLLATTANAIFAAALAPLPEQLVPAPAPAPLAARTWADRQQIVERNLFNSSTLTPPVAAAEPEPETLEATRLPLRLLGTAAASEASFSWAAIEDLEARETRVVRVDDEVKPRATVTRIERRRIVLDENGSPRELTLDEETEAAASPRRSSAASRSTSRRQSAATPRRSSRSPSSLRRVDEDRFEVSRDEMAAAMRDPTSLFNQARIAVKTGPDNQIRGLEIKQPKPGSVFEEVGIESGDVIVSVNGARIDSAEDSRRLMDELRSGEDFTVEVEGESGTRTVTIAIPD